MLLVLCLGANIQAAEVPVRLAIEAALIVAFYRLAILVQSLFCALQ